MRSNSRLMRLLKNSQIITWYLNILYVQEEIQAKMEEMAQENNMKDQIIEELQMQMQKNGGRKNDGDEDDEEGEEFQGDKDELH